MVNPHVFVGIENVILPQEERVTEKSKLRLRTSKKGFISQSGWKAFVETDLVLITFNLICLSSLNGKKFCY